LARHLVDAFAAEVGDVPSTMRQWRKKTDGVFSGNGGAMPVTAIRPEAVEALRLDAQNPRLPEDLQGAAESKILRHLAENDALEEIAQSYVDNGFFPHEPVIILDKPERDGRHIVLEGNRRLAALKILLRLPEAEGVEFTGIDLTAAQAKTLRAIPCFPIASRDEVHAYLGFRHIGGIKTWRPEAKARYIHSEIERIQARSKDPFRDVGRRVGSNAAGIRNPYIAIRILEYARDEFGLKTSFVQVSRFGVWLRAMNSPEIRDYIGVGDPKTYDEVQNQLRKLDKKRLAEVLKDFAPASGQQKAVLGDSRDVTNYGRVIASDAARSVLRKTADLQVAKQILDRSELAARVYRITAMCKVLLEEMHGADIDSESIEAIRDLNGVVRSMRAVASQGSDE
jgi:transposase-like protein